MTPQVEVDRNFVTVQGVKIERRASCSPSEWLEFWNREDLDDANATIEELEKVTEAGVKK